MGLIERPTMSTVLNTNRFLVRQQVGVNAEKILAKLAQSFDKLFRLILGPLLVDSLGHRTLDQRLERFARIISRVVKLCVQGGGGAGSISTHTYLGVRAYTGNTHHIERIDCCVISTGGHATIFGRSAVAHSYGANRSLIGQHYLGSRCHAEQTNMYVCGSVCVCRCNVQY